jgi:hypothetical protein
VFFRGDPGWWDFQTDLGLTFFFRQRQNAENSGCSTLLKTMAGEMDGIYLGENSHINYRGEVLFFFPTPFSLRNLPLLTGFLRTNNPGVDQVSRRNR